VPSQLLNEEPTLDALLGVFCGHYLSNLIPVEIREGLHVLIGLDHVSEEGVLE